jgi:hypothetical protein
MITNAKNKPLAVATFRYIDDVLSINNDQFHSYVDSIYSSELEIKDTTELSTSASYLDVLLNGKLTTQLYDKRDYFDFAIVSFPFTCSNIPLSTAYGVYISADSIGKGLLYIRTDELMLKGFQQSRLVSTFRKFYGRIGVTMI